MITEVLGTASATEMNGSLHYSLVVIAIPKYVSLSAPYYSGIIQRAGVLSALITPLPHVSRGLGTQQELSRCLRNE